MKRQLLVGWSISLWCGVWCCATHAEQLAPLTLAEIQQLTDDGSRLPEIVEEIGKRGLDFELDQSSAQVLRKLGFSRRLLNRLKKNAAKAPVQLPPLDPAKEADYERFEQRIKRILAESQTGAAIVQGEHITIICDQAIKGQVMKVVGQMERLLGKRFPGRLGAGPDRRVANIALFSKRYDYQKWIRAMFAVYEAEGFEFEGMNVLERAQRSERYLIDGLFNCCLENMTPLAARHSVAYAIGHHYLTRLTEDQAPAALATGFGNVAEVMLLRMPTMMLNSGYSDRKLGGGRNQWALIVRQRFAQNLVPSIERVLEYNTGKMQLPEYAECWSLAAYLAESEEAFANVVDELQAGGSAVEAIEKNYATSLKELREKWRKWAMR